MSTCNCWSKAAILMLEIIRLLQVLASLDTKFLSWLPDSHKICHMPFTAMLITCCAYSCTQYSLHTQYMLLTHVNDLLCLQLHTVQSPHTVHASDPYWWLAVPTAAHSTVCIHSTCFWPILMTCCAYSCTQYSLHTQYICISLASWKKSKFHFMKIIIFPSLPCTNVQRTPLTTRAFLKTNADSAVTTDWAPQEFALCQLHVFHWRSTSDGGQPYRSCAVTASVAAGNVVCRDNLLQLQQTDS